jgi:tetratricopeptide (TPR) repeat protein
VDDTQAETRYHLLETLRQYGRERLVASGEADGLHQRHADYYLALAEEAEPYLTRSEQLVYLARLDLERDNLRAALRWYLNRGDADKGVRLAHALAWFWWFRSLMLEAHSWRTQFLSLPMSAPPSPTRAAALTWAGEGAVLQGDVATGRQLLLESLTLARQLGDDRGIALAMLTMSRFGGPDKEQWYHASDRELAEGALLHYRVVGDRWGIAETLAHLGHLATMRGDLEQARRILGESLAVARTLGDRRCIAYALEVLGLAISVEDEREGADRLTESLRLHRECGHLFGAASVEILLGRLDASHGRFVQAREHYRASLKLTKDWHWLSRIIEAIEGLASVAANESEPERAVRLAAAGARLRDKSGIEGLPIGQRLLEDALSSVRGPLGETAFAATWADGQAMTLEQAVAYALSDTGPGA